MAKRRFVAGVDSTVLSRAFYGGLRPIVAEWLGVDVSQLTENVSYGLPEWKLASMGGYDPLHRFAVTQRQLFEKIEPVNDAAASLRRLSEHQVRIRSITHRLFIKFFHGKAASPRQSLGWSAMEFRTPIVALWKTRQRSALTYTSRIQLRMLKTARLGTRRDYFHNWFWDGRIVISRRTNSVTEIAGGICTNVP
jgi:hypothetical protein